MNKLQKELRKLLDRISEYKGLDGDERTDERREQQTADMARVKQLESDIRDLEEIEALEARMDVPVNDPPVQEFKRVEVEDQPIYRGKYALGQQLRDIINISTNRNNPAESRARLEAAAKREQRAAGTGMVELTAEDGGWLLQGESSLDLMADGFNNGAVTSRIDSRSISGSFVDVIEVDDSSNRGNGYRGGGVRWYTDAELVELTSSKTKFRKTRVEPHRLTGLFYMSNELDSDAPFLQGEMKSMFGTEYAFKIQDLIINGTGSGTALGILNSGALVSVAKESGQTAATIVYENLVKMVSRVRINNLNSLVWLVNQDTFPQLMSLTIAVGTGGSVANIFVPNLAGAPGVIGTLLGYPVIPIEQAATLGTVGDIMLCDLSQYRGVDKGSIKSDTSIHVQFLYNQLAVRFISHFDGMPKTSAPVTPYKGSATVSPFVALATRS